HKRALGACVMFRVRISAQEVARPQIKIYTHRMPYNSELADRVRAALSGAGTVEEKKMFGGLMFMVNGKMCVSVGKNRIMCRIDPALHDDVLKKKRCRPVVMRGREYKGYVHVDEADVATKKEFNFWIGLALDYNKKASPSSKRTKR